MRLTALLASAILLTLAPTAFARDTGTGVASIGPTAKVTSSFSRGPDNINASLGFTSAVAGHGVTTLTHGLPNPTFTSGYTVSDNVLNTISGKGHGTQNSVPGRNDPMPILSGKREPARYGGLSE